MTMEKCIDEWKKNTRNIIIQRKSTSFIFCACVCVCVISFVFFLNDEELYSNELLRSFIRIECLFFYILTQNSSAITIQKA